MPKKQVIGVVTSDKMEKTRRVEVPRLVKHPKYGKYIRQRTVCHVHDEKNCSKMGDTVEIIECPPRSKRKRWELIRVVAESRLVDLAGMRAAASSNAATAQPAAEKSPDTTGADSQGADSQGADSTGTGSTDAETAASTTSATTDVGGEA